MYPDPIKQRGSAMLTLILNVIYDGFLKGIATGAKIEWVGGTMTGPASVFLVPLRRG